MWHLDYLWSLMTSNFILFVPAIKLLAGTCCRQQTTSDGFIDWPVGGAYSTHCCQQPLLAHFCCVQLHKVKCHIKLENHALLWKYQYPSNFLIKLDLWMPFLTRCHPLKVLLRSGHVVRWSWCLLQLMYEAALTAQFSLRVTLVKEAKQWFQAPSPCVKAAVSLCHSDLRFTNTCKQHSKIMSAALWLSFCLFWVKKRLFLTILESTVSTVKYHHKNWNNILKGVLVPNYLSVSPDMFRAVLTKISNSSVFASHKLFQYIFLSLKYKLCKNCCWAQQS